MSLDPFLGEIAVFPYAFAPAGWADCSGQLLPLAQNTALFSLLGTTYGGNGTTTFALPDLNGRTPLGHGSGPGLSDRLIGEKDGIAAVTLTGAEMPPHSHMLTGLDGPGRLAAPAGALPAVADEDLYVAGPGGTRPRTLGPAGGGLPHENRQPYLVLRFCIALQGVYPQRP